MTEREKIDSDVELPSLSLPDDSAGVGHETVPIGEFGLRDDEESATSNQVDRVASESSEREESGDASGYRVSDLPPPASPAAPVTPPVESTFEPKQATSDGDTAVFPSEPPGVREVWTRWVEWKEPALWIAAAIGIALIIYLGGMLVTTLIVTAGLGYGLYHLVITLEPPVRVTPEQAVNEFFAAISHRLPNFARAYALLTDEGRQTDDFSDQNDFRAYWIAQLARIGKFPVWLVPLEFRVEGVTCRYDPEKTMALLKYRLCVGVRSASTSKSSLAELDARNLAVKGPDGQWYLNDGRLPVERQATPAAEDVASQQVSAAEHDEKNESERT